MNRVTSEILYWIIVLVVYLLMTYDGPPLRTVAWYTLHKACQSVAYHVGKAGIIAERKYMESVERMPLC